MNKPIYLDHHATTPVDPRVLKAMLPYFTEIFGNAASIDHDYGFQAKKAVDQAREQIANLINASPDEIIFTSGATEADNLAVLGTAEKSADKGKHIITCVTEHKAILDTCHYLETKGWTVTYLPVDTTGLVDPEHVRKAITNDTVLITIMTANNEIGTIAPVAEIGAIAREYGIPFHTDAAQTVGHIPMDVESMNIDMLSISGHKAYGPKGVGALYVRKRQPRIKLEEQIHGGGHERGMRSGTLNVPGIVGIGKAMEIAQREIPQESTRLKELRDQLWTGLKDELPNIELNGHPTQRLPHNLNIHIPGVESKSLIVRLKDQVALSAGSACSTTKVEPSHVILALGYDEIRAYQSIRMGLGKVNSACEIPILINNLCEKVKKVVNLT
jgi:cysteine desulfurase